MPQLPSGTVTFLFTDIEGSTRLWEQHPDAMHEALARHDAHLRAAIESHGGIVFKTVGDQFCAVFSMASDALAAALAAQHSIAECGMRSVRTSLLQWQRRAMANEGRVPGLRRSGTVRNPQFAIRN